jgi:PncC family amidohydrolase
LNTLQAHGAVSRETALEMARGARKALGADIALSVSGVAGPGGGLPGKPVGTTWVGLSAPDGEWARLFHFDGDREENKALATDAALQLLLEYLQGTGDLGNR